MVKCMDLGMPKLPYEINEAEGKRLIHLFLRFKAIVATNPDVKLYVSSAFLRFLRTRLSVSKCTTLTGRVVNDMVRIDAVDINVDEDSTKPFYIYY